MKIMKWQLKLEMKYPSGKNEKKISTSIMFLVVLLLVKLHSLLGTFTEVISNVNPQNETIVPSTGFTLNSLL